MDTQRSTDSPEARMMANWEHRSASSFSLTLKATGRESTLSFFSGTASSFVMMATLSRSLSAASNSS